MADVPIDCSGSGQYKIPPYFTTEEVALKKLFERLGLYLKEKREAAGLSQSEVAKKLGYSSPQFISNCERGLCALPLDTLKTIIKLYSLSPSEVIELILEEQEKHMKSYLMGRKSTGSKKSKRTGR